MTKIQQLSSFSLLLVFAVVLLAPNASRAADYGIGATVKEAQLPMSVAGSGGVAGVAGNIVASALAFVGVIFFILVLYAGFMWMTARGDSGKIDKAKSVLEDAVIGVVLVSAAYAIANFVFGTVVGGGQCAAVGGVCMNSGQCEAGGGRTFTNNGVGDIAGGAISAKQVVGEKSAGICPGNAANICCIEKSKEF